MTLENWASLQPVILPHITIFFSLLTRFILIDFHIHIVTLRHRIAHFTFEEAAGQNFYKIEAFLSLKIAFILANNADPDKKKPPSYTTFEPQHEISNNVICASSKVSDQPAHTRSLVRAFACRLIIQ